MQVDDARKDLALPLRGDRLEVRADETLAFRVEERRVGALVPHQKAYSCSEKIAFAAGSTNLFCPRKALKYVPGIVLLTIWK